MPLEGEHRAEVLTAYLDGELADSQRVSVDDQLANDDALRTELADLRQLQGDLRSHFASAKQSPPASLQSDIMERIAASKPISTQIPAETGRGLAWVASIAAIAACLLLGAAIFSDQLFPNGEGVEIGQQSEENSNEADTDPGLETLPNLDSLPKLGADTDDGSVQHVSEIDFHGLYYVLVVDVVISDEALRKDVVGQLFAEAKFQQAPPIVLDDETAQKIQEARMNVAEEDAPGNASLYFMRASIDQVSHVLDSMYVDEVNFPEIAFDIAVDNDRVEVMKAVAKSTGTRFAVSDPFAAPVSVDAKDVKGSRFSTAKPERFVSKEMRREGVGSIPAPLASGDLSTVMLIVRQQEL